MNAAAPAMTDRCVPTLRMAPRLVQLLVERRWDELDLGQARGVCRELTLREGRCFLRLRRLQGDAVPSMPDMVDVLQLGWSRWPFEAMRPHDIRGMADGLLRGEGWLRDRRAGDLWWHALVGQVDAGIGPAALASLVSAPAAHAKRHGVTGIVACAGGGLIQWLEGPRDVVGEIALRVTSHPMFHLSATLVDRQARGRFFRGLGMTTDRSFDAVTGEAFRTWLAAWQHRDTARIRTAVAVSPQDLIERFWADRAPMN